jgi:hypothetical protein
MKIVSSKKLAQMIMCYFVFDTLAFSWMVVLSSSKDMVLSHALNFFNNIEH